MAHLENLSGHTLAGNYFLKEKKGSGQISDVYRAWDKKRTAQVAVKVLRRDHNADREIKQIFSSEAELMAKLDHPHIVRLYEFRDEGRLAFFVMDWVEGIDLKAALTARAEPYELAEVIDILKPVSSALNYAHTQKIIHCDVKPANILIEQTGKVLLTDFGIARRASQKNAGGTPPYMAPEQFENGHLTPRTDVYALGITVFELLSGGQVPFRGETKNNQSKTPTTLRDRIYWEVMNLPYPSLQKYNASLPAQVDEILSTAMAKNPYQRFASALEFSQAFKALSMERFIKPPSKLNTYTTSQEAHSPSQSERPVEQLQPSDLLPKPADARVKIVGQLPEGFKGAYLVCHSGQYRGYLVLLDLPYLSIGRSSSNSLRLQDRSVSRLHASLHINKKGVFIQDEGSTLGTVVNGHRMPRARLRVGDVVQFGYADQFELRKR